MKIGPVDTDDRVVVIAELGNNHEGDPRVAAELVAAAAAAGADAVKFQAIDPLRLVRPTETARIRQLEGFRLSPETYASLSEQARSLGLGFVCTPFDVEAVGWLDPLVDAFKIASGDNDLHVLIRACARTGHPVVVSLGMADADAAARVAGVVGEHSAPFAVLHCVSAYPTAPENAALGEIQRIARAAPGAVVGYSDHVLGIEASIAAVALGARIIEKHFTLRHDHSEFRDHQLSADPAELAELVRRIRLVEQLVAAGEPEMSEAEASVAAAARRSIVAGRDLPSGHVLGEEDLWWLRPADGMAPGREHELLGRALRRDVAYGEPLEPGDVT